MSLSLAGRMMMRSQRRTVVDMPNRVKEYRKVFVANPHLHGADNPTYLKKGKVDEYIAWGAAGLAGVAMLMVLNGLKDMALGINKTK